jgi:20S proteasome alpha/beta subunit
MALVLGSILKELQRSIKNIGLFNMTTIACDGKTIACEGFVMHGGQVGPSLLLDTRNEKIIRFEDSFIGTSGGLSDTLILEKWLRNGGWNQKKPNEEVDITGIIFYKNKTVFEFDCMLIPYRVRAPFAIGSGRYIAVGAMEAGATSKEAIKIAIKHDIYSGGKIREYSF